MRTSERLKGLKAWAEENLCAGRMMKTIPPDGDIGRIARQEPRVFLVWQPMRPDSSNFAMADAINVCPAITIMPGAGRLKYVEEQHFDRYKNIHRGQELGRELSVTMLFSVYEPGVRMPGFIQSAQEGQPDMGLLREGSENGLFTLTDWMDECAEKLLNYQCIPGTDLFLVESECEYSLYTDQNYVVDKRPVYYGFINAKFMGYADNGGETMIDKLLY